MVILLNNIRMRFIIIFFVFQLIAPFAQSQDVHLTQYYTSNISLNPAYTGNYFGDLRLVANYRSQWGQVSTPIKTNFFSIEKRLLKRFPDEIGVGALFVNDAVSSYNLHTNKIIFSGSYQREYNKNVIRVGLQMGFVFRSINLGPQQTFPDQWNYPQGKYDPNLPNGETNIQNTRFYGNTSIGAAWTRRFGKAKVSAGYAMFNLNRPRDGFVAASKGLPFRHVFNTSVVYSLSAKTNLIPHVLYMRTARATDFIGGTNVTYMMKENVGVLFGAGYRGSTLNSDAVIATTGLIYNRLQFGLSWDFTVSKLNQYAKSKSAWEVMITYTTPSRISGKITLPCERY
jgi:type IX secretion system PorP/SprF family membrane protein